MWHLHDATTSGHIGIYRTLQRASRSSYYWPGMKQCVRDYVKFCQICEERKYPGRKRKNDMETYIASGRFEQVAEDVAGQFPKTENNSKCLNFSYIGLFSQNLQRYFLYRKWKQKPYLLSFSWAGLKDTGAHTSFTVIKAYSLKV